MQGHAFLYPVLTYFLVLKPMALFALSLPRGSWGKFAGEVNTLVKWYNGENMFYDLFYSIFLAFLSTFLLALSKYILNLPLVPTYVPVKSTGHLLLSDHIQHSKHLIPIVLL